MAYKIRLSPEIRKDLDLIFDHLVESYRTLGDPLPRAFQRASRRIAGIRSDMNSLTLAPHQGTRHDDIRPDLRHVTKNNAVFYFHVDDEAEIVRVVAVFFGGRDHQRHVLRRLDG